MSVAEQLRHLTPEEREHLLLKQAEDRERRTRQARQNVEAEDAAKAAPLQLIRASDVPVVKVDWLWYARLARGAISLLEGPPENGKSTVTGDLAARETRGHPFPGEHGSRPPGSVVMLIAEDDLSTTVVPRLRAAGADLTRVFFLTASKDEQGHLVPFHLSDDGDKLRWKVQEVGATLVIVDPLVSFLGSRRGKALNTNNDLEVRKSLGPLKELAEQTRAAVVAIRHHRKGVDTNAMEAGGGSIGFAALVRVIIAALPDPRAQDDRHYVLAVAKNNLVAKFKRPAFGYEIVASDDDPDIGCIRWGDAVDMSANEVMRARAEGSRNKSGKAAEARAFLQEFLGSGEWTASTQIFDTAKETHGLSADAVRRARATLPIRVDKRGETWGWRLEPEVSGEF
jgi:putative DNA primase/helicase